VYGSLLRDVCEPDGEWISKPSEQKGSGKTVASISPEFLRLFNATRGRVPFYARVSIIISRFLLAVVHRRTNAAKNSLPAERPDKARNRRRGCSISGGKASSRFLVLHRRRPCRFDDPRRIFSPFFPTRDRAGRGKADRARAIDRIAIRLDPRVQKAKREETGTRDEESRSGLRVPLPPSVSARENDAPLDSATASSSTADFYIQR